MLYTMCMYTGDRSVLGAARRQGPHVDTPHTPHPDLLHPQPEAARALLSTRQHHHVHRHRHHPLLHLR